MKIPCEVIQAFLNARSLLAPILEKVDWGRLSVYDRDLSRAQRDPVKDRIDNESVPYLRVATYLRSYFPKGGKVVDVGSFTPTLPLMLENLGFEVVTIERHDLYGGEYEKVVEGLKSRGITFWI